MQVKSTVTAYSHFGPAYRALILEEAKLAGAVAALVWWPRGKGIANAVWLDESAWP